MKLNSLTPNIMVDDMVGTLSWYEDVLGFGLVMQVPEEGIPVWAMMTKDSVTLMFQTRDSIKEELPELGRRPLGGGLGFYIKMDDIEGFCNEVKQEIDLVKELNKTFYGTLEFTIEDNNGFMITFAEDIS